MLQGAVSWQGLLMVGLHVQPGSVSWRGCLEAEEIIPGMLQW